MKLIDYIKVIVLVVIVMVTAGGCNKVSHNGSIDGNWEIMNIEDRSTGDNVVPDPRRFIAIQLRVMQLSSSGGLQTSYMTYDKKAETITCSFPYIKENQVESILAPYGIRTNPITFEVIKADRGSLVLRTPQTVITCRRF